jgi:SAM (Sterile alpha motif) domain-containing protein
LWLRRITSKAAGYSRRRCRSAYLLGAPGPEAYCSKKTLDQISYEGAMQQVADWLEKLGLGQYAQRFAEK